MHVRKFELVVAARTEGGYLDAIEEASRLINEGYLSGSNSNDDGGFYFTSTSDVPTEDLPAGVGE